jgi:hypothetical protein
VVCATPLIGALPKFHFGGHVVERRVSAVHRIENRSDSGHCVEGCVVAELSRDALFRREVIKSSGPSDIGNQCLAQRPVSHPHILADRPRESTHLLLGAWRRHRTHQTKWLGIAGWAIIHNMTQHSTTRSPLTGFLSVEWVDAGDPEDANAPANFGWYSISTNPPLDKPRLLELLRRLAESVQEDINDGDDGPHGNEGRLAR